MALDNDWPLDKCFARTAWDLQPSPPGKKYGEGIIIVHPDTGWTNHPELIKDSRYITDPALSKNFFSTIKDTLAEDTLTGLHKSHGTTTASLMMSLVGHPGDGMPGNTYPGYPVPATDWVTGIAPLVKVIPIRVSNFVMLGTIPTFESWKTVNTYASLTKAIYYALSLDPESVGVISISLGGPQEPKYLEIALIKARQNGIIICAAAGQLITNWEIVKPKFPGSSPHTICVAGCDENYDKPSEGFYGSEVDITSPGWNVIVARTKGDSPSDSVPNPPREFTIDKEGEGTSYSTALTAGACALWQAYHNREELIKKYGRPFLFDAFKYCLVNSCLTPPNWDTSKRGAGLLSVRKLLQETLPSVSTIEEYAISNNWTSSYWGDRSNWGRI